MMMRNTFEPGTLLGSELFRDRLILIIRNIDDFYCEWYDIKSHSHVIVERCYFYSDLQKWWYVI